MLFTESELKGLWVIEPQPHADERGFFARMVCGREFAEHGLQNVWPQQNIAFNHRRATLRGMHYQRGAAAEIKVVRCTRGAVYDVAVDLRVDSPTYLQFFGAELTAENHRMLYIPENFAHGYITLSDDAEISYLVSQEYTPGAEAGLRYDDPAIGIVWPMAPELVSEKDRAWPLLSDAR